MADLLPITSPMFNIREVCKNILLLEGHLNHPQKRCPDCIRKHFTIIEALLEEAVSLDTAKRFPDLHDHADAVRGWQTSWASGADPGPISQALRIVRKRWLPECFDISKISREVALRHIAVQLPPRNLRQFLPGIITKLGKARDVLAHLAKFDKMQDAEDVLQDARLDGLDSVVRLVERLDKSIQNLSELVSDFWTDSTHRKKLHC